MTYFLKDVELLDELEEFQQVRGVCETFIRQTERDIELKLSKQPGSLFGIELTASQLYNR